MPLSVVATRITPAGSVVGQDVTCCGFQRFLKLGTICLLTIPLYLLGVTKGCLSIGLILRFDYSITGGSPVAQQGAKVVLKVFQVLLGGAPSCTCLLEVTSTGFGKNILPLGATGFIAMKVLLGVDKRRLLVSLNDSAGVQPRFLNALIDSARLVRVFERCQIFEASRASKVKAASCEACPGIVQGLLSQVVLTANCVLHRIQQRLNALCEISSCHGTAVASLLSHLYQGRLNSLQT
mmetsp:Transcript_37297/g.89190  ORF Transcript_37297/g.89190 Transcript_37297/m.89190 type:complete len:237 (-) Transcript_37297:217-927(-)